MWWVSNTDMWPYWLLFLVPAFQAVSRIRPVAPPVVGKRWPDLWRVMFLMLVLMIGLRHEVGGDWNAYLRVVTISTDLTSARSAANGDPAYIFLNFVAAQSGLGIYLVNSVNAILFTWGLLVFCRNQPRPWLALTVAVPYLITMVAMGYSRQGVAIGLSMLGLVALKDKNVPKFLFWLALAAMFHKSAIILIPLAALAASRRRVFMLLLVGVTMALLFVLLLQAYSDDLVKHYLVSEYKSSGAAVRIAMNAFPAALFLLLRKRFKLPKAQRIFWTWMALVPLMFVALLYLFPFASTAIDRMALYWIPLQLFVLSRLPDVVGRSHSANASWVYAVVGYSAAVHFVWLFFAVYSRYWLPYQFYPWVWLWQ
jgi:hypothetical protein